MKILPEMDGGESRLSDLLAEGLGHDNWRMIDFDG
jgi:hypothetical protein